MNDTPPLDNEELFRRMSRDLADSYDEELEMEVEDRLHVGGLYDGEGGYVEALAHTRSEVVGGSRGR